MDKPTQHTYPDELIIGYLTNELSETEQLELKEWLSADASHERYLYEMTEVWMASNAISDNPGSKEKAYHQFKQRVDQKRKNHKLFIRWTQIAASIFVGVLLLGGGVFIGKTSTANIASAIQVIETPLGSRSRIVLQDGTVAWLNAGSKLSYPSAFLDKNREVKLEGEAYFEVVSDKKHSFIVHTSEVDVEVLGTKFSVRDYGEDDEIEVILAEGSVKFYNKKILDASFVMTPGQQVIFDKINGTINHNDVPVSQASIWTTGAHFFNELTFDQVAKVLEKSFDVIFIFRDEKKKDITFYSDFRSDESLDVILDILSSNRKFRYTISQDIVEIF